MKRICASDQFTQSTLAVDTAAPVGDLPPATGVDGPAVVKNAQPFADKMIDHAELKLGWWAVFVNALAGWRERRQTHKILRGLSDSQLKDIGLSCRDVDQLYGERDDSRKVWPNWPK